MQITELNFFFSILIINGKINLSVAQERLSKKQQLLEKAQAIQLAQLQEYRKVDSRLGEKGVRQRQLRDLLERRAFLVNKTSKPPKIHLGLDTYTDATQFSKFLTTEEQRHARSGSDG